MLGHVSQEDLPRWYNACDVFVMPNREIDGDNEGFGMVYLEAAACGKPVIGGKDGGTGSAIQDEVTGLRVDGSNSRELENALLRLLTNNKYAKRMGALALARANREFGWDHVARMTEYLWETK
jgi:phosphatidylinositol alpha-1,6-mannosyltransferase